MSTPGFNTDVDLLDNLFPFYLIIDHDMKVVSAGRSIRKVYPEVLQFSFSDSFSLKRPNKLIHKASDLDELMNQLVIIETRRLRVPLILRGTLNHRVRDNGFMFAGSAWFSSMDEVVAHSLTLNDFSPQDPMIDMLHILKNQEIVTQEVKQLLVTVNKQKNELKKSETQYRSIVESAADIVYKVNTEGRFIFANKVAVHITGHSMEELLRMHYLNMVTKDHKKRVAEFYQIQISQKIPTTYLEFPIWTKSEKEIWLGQTVQFSQSLAGTIELTSLAIDITQRRMAEQNLSIQEEKYRNIIANMNLGLLEVDTDDKIQYANKSFLDMSGYSLDEAIGQRASDLILSEEDKTLIEEKMASRKKVVSDLYPLPIRTKDREQRWWLISGAPRYNDKGELVGSVGIHLDITEQKRLEIELKEAKLKAEESSKSKETFLATMSHEIRTPLNAIVGIAELMKMDEKSRNEENLNILGFSAKNLLALITDILDISKIDAGKIEIANNTVNLIELLNGIYQMFKPNCDEIGLELILAIDTDVPHIIRGDELRLSQILNNLISNAIKFTHKGFVKICVKSESIDLIYTRLHFRIIDTGIGVKKNNLSKIFEAFEQADTGIVRRFGGTGLGLNITQKLIEIQGGQITVESKLGKGSTFSFYLDFQIPKLKRNINKLPAAENTASGGIFADKRILLVEDNVVNQKVAVSFLNHCGLKSDIANNGKEALGMMTKKTYDAVLLDLFMPVMDGFETLRLMRKAKGTKSIPVIALTASAETSLMERAIGLGANKCLTKPFNPQELHDTILSLLHIENESKVKPTKKKQKVHKENQYGKISLDRIEQASLGSMTFIAEMIDLLSAQIPELLIAAENHFAKKDFLPFADAIHKLKYNVLMFGLDDLRSDFIFLEEKARLNTEHEKMAETFDHLRKVCTEVMLYVEGIKQSWI